MPERRIDVALEDITRQLRRLRRPFALVGGLAVSQRAEPRFTRDVDLAIVAARDADVEWLVQELRLVGYAPVTVVEHIDRKRLSTVRLASRSGIVVDLIAATSGIEEEVVARATPVTVGAAGELPVARGGAPGDEGALDVGATSAGSDRRREPRAGERGAGAG